MGDPLSIASGVAGLVSLGLTVCSGLHTYFSAIKDRKDDLAIVTQNLALFKFHIFAVQSSASKLGHRHSPAIDGLQLSLINCEIQLKYLESLLNELMLAEDPSLAKVIWRRQKLIARYPFNREKLVQLEEYLSRANATLSSFIQALNLDINIHMSDDLEAFKTSLEALDINTQTTLRTITNRLDVIGPKVEPSTLQLLPSRVEDVTASSSNNIFLHQTAAAIAELKTCCLGNERSSQDLTNAHSTPCYLQNAKIEKRLCKKLADMNCTYGASNRKTGNCSASRTYRFWGGLTVSRQGDPCNVVESSPAFQIFTLSPESVFKIFAYDEINLGPDRIAENIIRELRSVYSSGRASPFDVDKEGNNIAFRCVEVTHFPSLQQPRTNNPYRLGWPIADWLLQYDLKLELSLEPFRLSALHGVAALIGCREFECLINRAKIFNLPLQYIPMSELDDARTLLAAISHSEGLCNIPCPCSSGMFSRPLAHVLPAILNYKDSFNSGHFFENVAENIEFVVHSIDLLKLSKCRSEQLYMAKCAIHVLTMMSLEDLEFKGEEWKEILDEGRELIDQLEALDEEFGEAFDRQHVPIAEFLSGYWLTRMEQVIKELNKPLTDDDRYGLLDAGVVLDEDETNGSGYCIEYTEDEV
ncbi:hypothetical protein FAGAP_5366 [Fusarium agapanthi]|uniref:Fungal N-terminal domain-containing protein n=1 Tax=Fusarium agapanthi TaxID=1803897 RepID=A0A9P5BB02_9HYPO|nr:hypothetical protein FAGAP_5366 [Fusarium agapanthi]